MSLTGLLSRVERLDPRPPIDPADCPNPLVGALVRSGEAPPPEGDVPRCPNCNGRHVLELEEVVVEGGQP
jgi:hypothetical protein